MAGKGWLGAGYVHRSVLDCDGCRCVIRGAFVVRVADYAPTFYRYCERCAPKFERIGTLVLYQRVPGDPSTRVYP